MVNGRRKGNNYENTICRALSLWLCEDVGPATPLAQLPFRRRSTSIMPLDGHWHGAGDILHRPSADGLLPFCVECKAIEGWSLDGWFSDRWVVWSWWEQAARQAEQVGLSPLLLCSRSRKSDYAFLRESDASCLQLKRTATLARPSGERVSVVLLDELVQTPRQLLRGVLPAKRSASASLTDSSGSTSSSRAKSGVRSLTSSRKRSPRAAP